MTTSAAKMPAAASEGMAARSSRSRPSRLSEILTRRGVDNPGQRMAAVKSAKKGATKRLSDMGRY